MTLLIVQICFDIDTYYTLIPIQRSEKSRAVILHCALNFMWFQRKQAKPLNSPTNLTSHNSASPLKPARVTSYTMQKKLQREGLKSEWADLGQHWDQKWASLFFHEKSHTNTMLYDEEYAGENWDKSAFLLFFEWKRGNLWWIFKICSGLNQSIRIYCTNSVEDDQFSHLSESASLQFTPRN